MLCVTSGASSTWVLLAIDPGGRVVGTAAGTDPGPIGQLRRKASNSETLAFSVSLQYLYLDILGRDSFIEASDLGIVHPPHLTYTLCPLF